jgi:predicted metalloprotease with PDZ domain
MINYRIDLSQAHAHRFLVTLQLAQPQPQVVLELPVWIPGSYLIREFARNLNGLQASQGGKPCDVQQLGKASWQVSCTGKGTLTVQYEVHANDPSVRAAFLDNRRGFFNGTSTFVSVQGLQDRPHRVQITGLPKGWSVATALPPVKTDARGQGWYEAPDHDALVDHPVELGTFWRGSFQVRGVLHELVVSGASDQADLERLLEDTQAICAEEIRFWHGRRKPPFQRYVFMLNVVEDGYGGLEHRDSTALICSRKDLPRQGSSSQSEGYTTLLGLISHEYFHTWNVKRLKPKEFAPYDYTRENHTQMLWFFEGFTSYYDDLILLRSGLLKPADYLKLLNKPINQVLATPGRLQQSVAQASFDAWTRYYRPDENTANSTVSYYTKGSLVALCLDLSLRLGAPRPDGSTPSLDGVMQRLWHLQRPISQGDVEQALSDEATAPPPHGKDWTQVLNTWVHGVGELPLADLLDRFGVAWTSKPPSLTQQWGLRTQERNDSLKVQAIMRGSPAEDAGLSAGDELLALNGWRLKKTEDLQNWRTSKGPQALLICRDQKLQEVRLPHGHDKPTGWGLSAIITARPASAMDKPTQARQEAWLRQG